MKALVTAKAGAAREAAVTLALCPTKTKNDALTQMARALEEKTPALLEANRADLYLQPIVTLPQRKVRYYEAFTRLRTEDGEQLLPADVTAEQLRHRN